MKDRDDIKALLEGILSRVTAPLAEAQYYYHSSLATRFAENAITQNMSGEEEHLRLVVAYGNRHGSSITNKSDAASIVNLVERAEDIANSSPEDPEYMPPARPQTYPGMPKRYYEDVAWLTPADLAGEIEETVRTAKTVDYRASGLYEASYATIAIANSEGLFAFDQVSNLNYSTTMHGPLGSGYSSQNGESLAQVSAGSMTSEALETASAAQNPRALEPGEYTVILEPQAVLDFLEFFVWNMNARDADEGTTVFAGKVGERLYSDKVNLETRIDDTELPAPPFGQDSLAARHTVWVENGIVRRLRHDRFWAREKGADPDPLLYPLFMDGQDQSVADLIAQCEKGLLVKRLWYIRYVDRKELLLTGMTRDGLFLLEGGKIVGPAKNLRFNESPVVFLRNVVAMSRPERVGNLAKVPAIMSEGFTFSSETESV
ncbi:hypothetical protein ES703_81329 [subsurface metagenome]